MNSYNFFIENRLPEILTSYYNSPLNKRGFEVVNISVVHPKVELSRAIELEQTYNYELLLSYTNRETGEMPEPIVIEVPKMVNDSFIIFGKYKTPTLMLDNDRNARFYETQFVIDPDKTFNYETGLFKYIDSEGNEVVIDVNAIEELPEEARKVDKSILKKIEIKFNLDKPINELTKDLLIQAKERFAGYNDKVEDHILDKKVLTVQAGLVNFIKSHKKEIYTRIASDLPRRGKIYASEMNKYIRKFFSHGGMIDNPSKVNSLTFSALSRRIKLSEYTEYNRSLVDIIDPIRTPENANANIVNELNVCSVIDEDGGISIRVHELDFKPIVLPYIDYFDAYIIDNQSVDYVNKKINPKVKVRRRGEVIGEYKLSEVPKPCYIDASADDKLSYSTRRIPMINYTDSIRVSMGGNMSNQAVELINPDVPAVSSGHDDGAKSHPLNIYALSSGVVDYKDRNVIKIKDEKGRSVEYRSHLVNSMYDLNVVVDPKVEVGDHVNIGDTIFAPRNITSEFRLGKNCRIAFMLHGNNYEDGVIMGSHLIPKFAHIAVKDYIFILKPESELTSIMDLGKAVEEDEQILGVNERMSTEDLDFLAGAVDYGRVSKLKGFFMTEGLRVPKDFGRGYFTDIIVQKGNVESDPNTEQVINEVFKRYKAARKEVANIGEIPESYLNLPMEQPEPPQIDYKYMIKVRLLQVNELKVGNKITNRYGSKGLCSQIIPEDEMPRTKDGQLIDVIMNADSTVARKIVSQLLELGLSNLSRAMYAKFDKDRNPKVMRAELSDIINPKLASYSDKQILEYHDSLKDKQIYPIVTGNFAKDISAKLRKYSDKYKVSLDGEHLYTKSGRLYTENKILVGDMYLMKLYQLPEKGAKVTSDNMKGKRPVLGANFRNEGQSLGEMEFWAYSANDLSELLTYNRDRTKLQDSAKFLTELLKLGLEFDGNLKDKKQIK